MASNRTQSTYKEALAKSIRSTVQVKKIDRYPVLPCDGCSRLFKSKQRLSLHHRSCIKIEKCESFLKYSRKRSTYNKIGKLVPPSQPLDKSVECHIEDIEEITANTSDVVEVPDFIYKKEVCANLPLFTKKDYSLKNTWGLTG